MLPNWFPESHIESAELVSDYLVTLRGGAPFLSGADAQLLIEWLDEDIAIPTILSALERVALKRRGKRVRTRLSLNASKGELGKLLRKQAPQAKSNSGIDSMFSPLSRRIRESVSEDSLFGMEQIHFSEALEKLVNSSDQTALAHQAIALLSDFHQRMWDQSTELQLDLLREAEEDLQSMRAMIPALRWNELLEEVARDRLRARFPLLTAEMIWCAIRGEIL